MTRLTLLAAALLVHPLEAQTPAPATPAETVTAAAVERHLNVFAAESLWDRRTPSGALDRAARYVAAQFRAAGLRPGAGTEGGDSAGWIQRYPVPGRAVRLAPASHVAFFYTPRRGARALTTETGQPVQRTIAQPVPSAARFLVPRVPEVRAWARVQNTLPTVLLTGRLTTAFLQQADLANSVVLYLPPAELDTAEWAGILDQLYRTSRGVVVLADSARFAAGQARATGQPLYLDDAYLYQGDDAWEPPRSSWAVEVQAGALADLLPVDLAEARAARAPARRELPELRMGPVVTLEPTDTATMPTAPNVIGILKGTDTTSESRCIALMAPLDLRTPRSDEAGRAPRGREASTVSLAGLLELARALAALPVRPYSVVFLATSGGAPGEAFWGSHYYLYNLYRSDDCKPRLTLALDLSVGGPAAADTAVLAGLGDVVLTRPPAWIAGAHPELGLAVADGGTVVRPRTDAFVFARRGYPSLLLQWGTATDDDAPADVTPPDVETATRLLRFMFYLTKEVTAGPAPRWSTDGRQRVAESQ